MDHLHRFQEMLRISELLPAGDIPPPNAALQVEWFYMSFHKSDRSEYVRSGRKLSDEMLDSLAEYFGAIFNAKLGNGSLADPSICKTQFAQEAQKALQG